MRLVCGWVNMRNFILIAGVGDHFVGRALDRVRMERKEWSVSMHTGVPAYLLLD